MKFSSGRNTSTSTSVTTTSASVSTSFSTDARPSTSSASSSSAASTTASPSLHQSSSSLAQLLRGVLQTVKTRRKRGECEKFLRALEKSGVDFADALLLSNNDENAQVPPSRLITESRRSSTRSNFSSTTSTSYVSTSPRHCMRRLDRIEKLQVRATVESVRAGGTLVTLQLLLITSPPRGSSGPVPTPLQQPQLQTQDQLSRGAAGVVVYQGLGALRQQRVHELTRPFDDFRKLRKMVAFCVRRGREHDADGEHHRHHNATQNNTESAFSQCSYCSEVRSFVAQCWEQPPLLETSMLSSNCTIRKGVLGSSMLHFVRLAKSEPLFPPRYAVPNNRGAPRSGAATAASRSVTDINGASNTNQNGTVPPPPPPPSSPKCQAHAEIATILHDFFRLQQLLAR